MNTSYKSIWNESLGAWVAASEVTKGRGKRSRSGAAIAAALVVLAGVAGLSSQAFAAGDFEAVGTPGTGAITVSPSGSSTNASAAGTNAIAVGTSATAPAVSSVAVGVNATAGVSGGGSGAAALGSGTKATGESSVAIGGGNGTGNSENNNAAVASADRSVAVGHNSNATAVNAVAIGTDAIASGSGSVAIGADAGGAATANVANAGAKATGPYSIAVGGMSQATGQSALAFGTGATAVFGNDMAFGTNAYASGDSSSLAPSTAFGNKSKATNYGTAFGVGAQALSYGSIAFGGDAKSGVDGGTRGVAMGVLASVSGDRGVAIGAGASSAGDRAVAYGWKTSAAASGAVAIGANADGGAAALEVGSIAIGGQSSVASAATSGIALGRGATTKGAFGIAQGDGATASEKNAIGIGTNAAASDANAIAVGDASKAKGLNSMAMGHQANAAGSHATALGADASALYDDSVALGSSSKTSATLAALQSTAAHTPFKGATIAGATPAGEVSVGAGGSERRVTNVAAGGAGTDAVNVSQLQAASTAAVQYDKNADGTLNKGSVTLGGTPATAPVKLGNVADGNVAAGSKDAVNGGQLNTTNQNVTNLGDSIRNGAIGPVQAVPGKTGQLTLVAPGATGAAPGNAQVLGNVAAGKAPSDAANVGQLDALAGSAVQYDKNADGTPDKSHVTLGGKNADGTPATAPVKLGNVADGNVAAGSKDAVNGGQLNAVSEMASKGWSLSANGEGAAAQKIAPGDTVDFVNGSNTTVSRAGKQIKVDVSRTPVFDSVTAASGTPGAPGSTSATLGANGLTTTGADGKAGPSVTTAGIDAGGKPITNVGAGTNDTDAANVAQVKAAEAKAGNAVQYDKNADGTPGKSGVTLGGLNADGTPATAPVRLANVADGNVAAGSKDAVNGGQLNTTNQNVTNLGDSIRNGAIGPVQAVPGKTDQLTLVAPGATSAAPGNAQVLSNVANGTAPNDAVNRGQLDTVSAAINKGWNLSANGEASPLNIAPGGAVDFINGSNTTVVRTGNQIKVDVSKTPVFDSVTAASGTPGAPGSTSATLGANGLTTIGADGKAGPSVTTAGIDAGGKPIINVGAGEKDTDAANVAQVKAVEAKTDNAVQYDAKDGAPGKESITLGGLNADGTPATAPVKLGNVADGNVAAGSKDAVNGGQLNTTNTHTNTFLGGGADVASGKAPTYDVAGGSFNDVGSALGAVDKLAGRGWNLSANGEASPLNIAPGGAVDFINGSNTSVSRAGNQIKVDVSKTPTFETVTATNGTPGNPGASATLGANGLTTTGADGKAGPSVTTAGIDAGGKPITNVGAGEKDTDAANVAQVKAAQANAGNAVQYDKNADGTPGKSGVTLGGLNADGTPATAPVRLANVADGNVAAGSKDAVNGGQLNTTNQNVTNLGDSIRNGAIGPVQAVPGKTDQLTLVAPGATSAAPGNAQVLSNVANGTAPNDAVNRGQLDTVSATANKGWNLSANGEASPLNIAPGGAVDFVNGSNTTVSRAGNQIKVDVSKTPTFESVTATNGTPGNPGASATLGANGLTTIGADGKAGPSVTTAGIDAGGKPVSNVGAGEKDTDAANVAQVKAAQAKAGNAVQYDAKDGAPGKDSITLGGLNADGTPATAPVKLTNVADGNVAAGSKDAVNGGQLNTTNQNVTNLGDSIRNGAIGPVQAVPGKTDQLTLVAPGATSAAPGNAQVLSNVANGTAPNDAVNRGQLDTVSATANKGWNLSANGEASPLNIAPGGAVDFVNGSNTTVSRAGNQIKVDVSKTPTFESVTATNGAPGNPGASATLGANGLTTTGADGKAGPSVITAGIDAGGKPIINVGAGTNDTDAANVAQVKAVEAKADNAVQYDAKDGAPGKDSITLGGLNADGTPATAPVKLANVADGNVAAGSKDAVNGGQLNTTNQNVTKLGDSMANGTIGPVQAVPGKTDQLTLVAPGATGDAPGNAQVLSNVADGKAPTDAANVGQLDALAGSAVQYDKNADGTPGKSAVTLGGKNADGTPATDPVKLGNVADGNVAAGSKDAVNGGQLNTTNSNTNTFLGGGADVASGKAPTYDVAGGSFNDVGSALGAVDRMANKGWNLSANGEATPQQIVPGGAVDFINGSNTTVIRTGNQIKVDVSKTPTFESVTTTNGEPGNPGASATLGADGLTTTGADGKAGPSVTTAGVDAGGEPITNVGAGTNDTDAANVAQVKAVEAKADNAVQYDAKDGAPGKESITLGGLNADGTPATAPVKLANVADGNVAAGSKDAINGGQLNTLGSGIANVLGGTYVGGVYTPSAFTTVGGGSATTVQGALDNLGTVLSNGAVGPVQRTGKDDQLALIAPGATGAAPGAAQQLTNVKNGELSSTSTDAVNGSQLHAVNEAVAAVGTKADNAVQYDKGADGAPGKAGITLGGMGADGKTPSTGPVKLGNVADGNLAEGSKDAVNGGQLFATNQNVTNLGNDLKNLSTSVNDGKVGPLQRTDNANELVLVGKDGTATNPGAAQRVTNVANGTGAGDAVNFGQLQEVANTANNSVQYDGADKGAVTMGGATSTDGGKTGGTRLGNMAQGAVNDKSTDAVNGAQLNATQTAVSNYLGGGANLNEGKAPSYNVQGNTYDNVGGALGSVNDNLTTVNNAINGGGMKYFRANSTLPDATAGGTDAVAVGPQAVAGGASSVAVGSGAQATSASGTAIGFKAVVQQTGGVALGAGSVASTAAGVAGHVPEGAGAQQASAVRATTSTQGAVSVGDAGNGQFRQITGVAAGTADSDAANVAQLKASASAVKAGSVQYDTHADGSINHGQITMGNGQAPDGTRISNVAPGVQGTDAVNLNQLNSAAAASMNYTDARFNQLGNAMRDIEKKSYAGTAAAMALENAPYVPGKVSYAAGMGHYQGQTAVGASLRKTAESGRWSVSGGVTATSAGTVGVRAGISGVWD